MGANEYGVVIGNEAVFTKVKKERTPRLLGMDLLRLALERAKSAEEAMHVIIELLEKYGQGGNCGLVNKMNYDNSYLIADTKTAWILETAGEQWAAIQVKDVGAISNRITIGSKWDLASKDLVKMAVEQGWCKKPEEFNFAKCYSEPIYTYFSASQSRLNCSLAKLMANKGEIDLTTMIDILKSHSSAKDDQWSPDASLAGADICMHFGFGPIRGSQTTASLVSEISDQSAVHWLTATSAPCTSIFKPVWLDSGLPSLGPLPTAIITEGLSGGSMRHCTVPFY